MIMETWEISLCAIFKLETQVAANESLKAYSRWHKVQVKFEGLTTAALGAGEN